MPAAVDFINLHYVMSHSNFHRARKLHARKRISCGCDQRGMGRVRHGESKQNQQNEGFDAIKTK